MMDGYQAAWVWLAVMPLLWIALVGLIVWLVARFAVGAGDRRAAAERMSATRETPEQILDRRFASGEIDEDTYTRARDRLASYRGRP
jgi:putative membrane protein